MKILAFDTSSAACSVALMNGDEVEVLHEIVPMKHAQQVLPMIQALLASFSINLNQLSAIAYGCGPGSFTGIRIASSIAQALGFALSLPIIRISSLAALAQTAFLNQQWKKSLISLDARMGQVYWAAYRVNPDNIVELVSQERLYNPNDPGSVNLMPNSSSQEQWSDWNGVGDGWDIYKENLIAQLGFRPEAINSKQLPNAKAILELAKVKFQLQEWIRPNQAIPEYLR